MPRLPPADALYAEAACGLVLTSIDGTILRVNQTFCRWTAYAAADLVERRRLQDLLTVGSRIFHLTHWVPLLQMQGSVAEVKLDLWSATGDKLPVLVNAVRRDQGGGVFDELAIFVAKDRHAYERELLAARTRAEELLGEAQRMQEALGEAESRVRQALQVAQERADFAEQLIGIVSHDLRTPLQVIRMMSHLLARDQPAPSRTKSLGAIDRATRRAQRLVEDLLDFTAVQVGRGLRVKMADVDIGQAVSQAVEELRGAHPDRTIEHQHRGAARAHADPHRIAQVVVNLVGNALAYGDPAQPVRVRSVAEDEGYEIAVHNAGAPIPAELVDRLFEPMVRGDDAGVAGSVGLGLFIVREIARAHGGEVTVASSAEAGTTFTLQIRRGAA